MKPPNYEVRNLSGSSKRLTMARKVNFMCLGFSCFDRVCLQHVILLSEQPK